MEPSAAVKTLSGVIPMFIATRRMKPAITEMMTDQMMPFGAARSASWVSSDMWAEASCPVSVYWAFSNPIRMT